MEQFKMGQLANGGWCVWQNRDQGVSVALATKEEAEKLMGVLNSSAEEEFDLPAFLLGEIYPHMNADACARWNLIEAEALARDFPADVWVAVGDQHLESVTLCCHGAPHHVRIVADEPVEAEAPHGGRHAQG